MTEAETFLDVIKREKEKERNKSILEMAFASIK